MYCKNCGAQIADDSKFCIHCGTKLFDDAPKNVSKVNPRIFEMDIPSFDDEPDDYYEEKPQGAVATAAATETSAASGSAMASEAVNTEYEAQPVYQKHHTTHVKKDHVYGDFGADLSERFEEFKADRKLDRMARRAANPQKYARRDFRRARARMIWGIVIGVVIVAWAIGRLKVLIG